MRSASSARPWDSSQRGDSGMFLRSTQTMRAPTPAITKPDQAPMERTDRQPVLPRRQRWFVVCPVSYALSALAIGTSPAFSGCRANAQVVAATLPIFPAAARQGRCRWRWLSTEPGRLSEAAGSYGWMTVGVRLMTNASCRSRKSSVTSAKASGRSALMACPASYTKTRWQFGINCL